MPTPPSFEFLRRFKTCVAASVAWRHEDLAATLSSIIVHLAVILILAIMVFQGPNVGQKAMTLFSSPNQSETSFELTSLPMPETPMELSGGERDAETAMEIETEAISIDSIALPVEFKLPERVLVEPVNRSEPLPPSAALSNSLAESRAKKRSSKTIQGLIPTISKKGTSISEELLTLPEEGVQVENSAQGAVGKILSQLERIGDGENDGPVTIIWLMDASLSLVDERQSLAPIVYSFYEKLEAKNKQRNLKLSSDVYAFGNKIVQVVHDSREPTPNTIAGAISKLPIDETGVENVMSALSLALNKVPMHTRDMRIEVVIWTDESGDDLGMLEDVIQQCRYRQARVHVVGPLSVLGMRQGLQQYVIGAPYNYAVMLPVNRGPDSAFVERARLPIWDSTSHFAWRSGNVLPSAFNGANFGGPHRERLLAPTGPYALTRLALATGGTFTALERPGDAAIFDTARLKEYLPDYRSGFEISRDIDKYPLRRAIIESAALMGDIEYWPPRFEFPSIGSKEFPYAHFVPYMEPTKAIATLEHDLSEDITNLLPVQQAIEKAIAMLLLPDYVENYGSQGVSNSKRSSAKPDDDGLRTPAAYDAETSSRWRAWYGLNLGRLLAHSVRINEYMNIRQRLKQADIQNEILTRGVNHFILVQSDQLYGGTDSEMRSKMARKLLERVIYDHPKTPWSQLASWELERPFGMDCRYSMISPPPPPRPVTFTFGPMRPMPQSTGMRPFPPPTIPRL